MTFKSILLQLCCVVGAFSSPSPQIVPCKRNDEACMTKSANLAMGMIINGIPSLGVDSLEPTRMKMVYGEIAKLFLNVTDNEITGYSKCTISQVKLNLDSKKLKFVVTCPSLMLTGHMVVTGELLDVPVEGDGVYKMITGKFAFDLDADVEKVATSDGVNHLAITTFTANGAPLEPFQFNYDLRPKRILSPEEAADFEKNKFIKIVQLVTPRYLHRQYGVMFKSVNKFLESVPFDDLFLDCIIYYNQTIYI